MELTVFTPTYNRAHLLPKLYESLCLQTNTNFEWLIVDDGSTDDTKQLIASYLSVTRRFPIRFISQANSGKHIAINRGAALASGELFFMVDSDDYLSADAIECVLSAWHPIRGSADFGGVVFNKRIIGGPTIGNPKYDQTDCRPLEFRYHLNEQGDKAEVIRTSIFKEHPFPETKEEKFCPEGLFFNRIQEKLRYLNKDIYYCDYLPDGLSARIFLVRKASPYNTCLYYKELAENDVPFARKMLALINFYRFSRYGSKTQVIIKPKFPILHELVTKFAAKIIYLLLDSRK